MNAYQTTQWQEYQFRESAHVPGDDDLAVELFARLTGNPAKRDGATGWQAAAHVQADNLPEWKRARDMVRGLPDWAARMAAVVAENLAAAREGDALDKLKARQAMRRGIEQVEREKEEADSLFPLLGGGGTMSGDDDRSTPQTVKCARMFKDDYRLKRILEIAGRLYRAHKEKRAARDTGGHEVVGVTTGADLPKLLPSQWAMPDEVLFKNLLERSALQYQTRDTTPKAKGPIVVMVDESGSMDGQNIIWAKGVALALLAAAMEEKRGFTLVAYGATAYVELACKPGERPSQARLLEAMRSFMDSGRTNWDAGFTVSRGACVESRADIVHITDGASDVRDAKEFSDWRAANGVTCYGVSIGCHVTPTLASVSDETCMIDPSSDGEFIETVLGGI